MFNITSIYQKKENYRFDFSYYLNVHMPRSISLLSKGKGYRGVSVERGIDLPNGQLDSTFVAVCNYYFDSAEDFLNAFLPHAQELQDDIKNYTDIVPINQVNVVEIPLASEGER
ncbi:EthD family reductase [Leptospira stimsonii]|uniref:EthD family reductase n=1 Tax=Leptospira stimsonii TaxID=2202203 RepID=A0A396Z1L6_9LEPT|nr:EthD family reductase [Leptospira stimsonii]RHX89352.1 EthD family reductase [Leptospira stimsonii]